MPLKRGSPERQWFITRVFMHCYLSAPPSLLSSPPPPSLASEHHLSLQPASATPACLLPGKPPPWQPAGFHMTCTRAREGKVPASRRGSGGSDVPTPKNSVCSSHGTRVPRRVWRRVQALTAERGGRHQASPDNCSTHSHSVGVQHLLFAKPCAKHAVSHLIVL